MKKETFLTFTQTCLVTGDLSHTEDGILFHRVSPQKASLAGICTLAKINGITFLRQLCSLYCSHLQEIKFQHQRKSRCTYTSILWLFPNCPLLFLHRRCLNSKLFISMTSNPHVFLGCTSSAHLLHYLTMLDPILCHTTNLLVLKNWWISTSQLSPSNGTTDKKVSCRRQITQCFV